MALKMIQAAYYGNSDAVNDVLRSGGDIEETDPRDGWRGLHAAAFTGQNEVVSPRDRQLGTCPVDAISQI